jgi:hypothetical protein
MSIKEKVHTIVKTFNNIYGHALGLSSFWLEHNFCCPVILFLAYFQQISIPTKKKACFHGKGFLEENKRKTLKPYVMNG